MASLMVLLEKLPNLFRQRNTGILTVGNNVNFAIWKIYYETEREF